MFELSKKEKQIIGTLVSMGYECTVRGDGWYVDENQFDTFKEFWEYAISLLPVAEWS